MIDFPSTDTTRPPERTSRGRPGEAATLALLTGEEARDLLELALGTAGAVVVDHAVHSVQHRPGDGVTVGYRVWVGRAGAHGDAPASEEYVLVSSSAGRDVPADSPGLVRLDGPAGRMLAWRHPHDPALPSLATACDPVQVEPFLPGDGPVTDLQLVGYRPLRRAVLRAVRGVTTSYVKVLRPAPGRGGAPDVVHRHTLLGDAGLPVPSVLSTTASGLVVLEQASGTPLVQAIGADAARGPDLRDLLEVLDCLPSAVADLPMRPPWADRSADYADAVAAGGLWGVRAHALADAVRARSCAADLGPVVPTHGDFHEGQLTVGRRPGGWAVTGLLDVDTVGPGHRVDDLACLIAHAIALGGPGERAARRWEFDALALVDPDVLRVRTAGVLLSLAAGAVHGDGPTTPGDLLDAAEERLAH